MLWKEFGDGSALCDSVESLLSSPWTTELMSLQPYCPPPPRCMKHTRRRRNHLEGNSNATFNPGTFPLHSIHLSVLPELQASASTQFPRMLVLSAGALRHPQQTACTRHCRLCRDRGKDAFLSESSLSCCRPLVTGEDAQACCLPLSLPVACRN